MKLQLDSSANLKAHRTRTREGWNPELEAHSSQT